MPGMTFVTAIFAVLRIPQRTLDIARHHSRKRVGGKTCAGQFLEADSSVRFVLLFRSPESACHVLFLALDALCRSAALLSLALVHTFTMVVCAHFMA
jgi:hypothetical protein